VLHRLRNTVGLAGAHSKRTPPIILNFAEFKAVKTCLEGANLMTLLGATEIGDNLPQTVTQLFLRRFDRAPIASGLLEKFLSFYKRFDVKRENMMN
jgi:hypothetical protein